MNELKAPLPYEKRREGLLAVGNFIIDHVKIIDYYPEEETLATILTQSSSNGGGPYNVLKDLSKLGAPFPLEAGGMIGADDGGRWIVDDCEAHEIGTKRLRLSSHNATSYTDAFTVQSTGKRTFFHQPGSNAHLTEKEIDLDDVGAKWFYLGYLMLLDSLDALDSDRKTGASRVLQAASEAGMKTIVDLVSKQHVDFAASAHASLPFIDVLVLNEIEAGRLVDKDLRPGGTFDPASALEASLELLSLGVREHVVIHAVEGCTAVSKNGVSLIQGSVKLPEGFSKGATGAGDAFAAGLIYGLHEEMPMEECLRMAVCAAASCLQHPSTSDGVRSLEKCLELGVKFGFRE